MTKNLTSNTLLSNVFESGKISINQMPKVSVVVVVKNDGIYALRLLKTLEKDIYANNLEIIFVDDGSRDDSVEKLKNYVLNEKLKNVKLFREDSGGTAAARNIGIEKSAGDYLIFLNPKDEPTPNFITALMLAAKNGSLVLTGIKEKLGAEKARILYSTLTVTKKPKETTRFYCERVFKKDDRLCRLNNKLFSAKIIKEHNLKFEGSSDLRFIKKYIELGEIENIVTINKPLLVTQKL